RKEGKARIEKKGPADDAADAVDNWTKVEGAACRSSDDRPHTIETAFEGVRHVLEVIREIPRKGDKTLKITFKPHEPDARADVFRFRIDDGFWTHLSKR